MSMRRFLLALLLACPGCIDFWAAPDAVEVQRSATPESRSGIDALQDEVADHPDDLGKRFALAHAQETHGLLEAASLNYGIVARELPEGLYTRPWLAFGRCELALGRDLSARKAFESVLAVVPEESSAYILNADYREAATKLAPLLARAEDWQALERLQRRYTDDLGGDPEEWPVH